LDDHADDLPDIVLLIEFIEQRRDSLKLSIRGIIIPRDGRHGVLWLEEVRNGRVIDDNNIFHGASQPRQILHIRVIEESAVLAEQKV